MKWAAEVIRVEGLPGLTQKFTIQGAAPYDFYLKLAWSPRPTRYARIKNQIQPVYLSRHLDYVDLTVSGLQEHNIRALVELACKEAYALLRARVWTVDNLIKEWRGYRFEPSGYCPQVNGIVHSPMDASARLIELRRNRWD